MLSLSLLLFLPLLAVNRAGAQPAQVPQELVTAFVHVAVIPMDRERVLRDQTVVVRGDRIVALGPAKRVTVPAGATIVDGRGKFLIPGLADMHMHGLSDEVMWIYLANGVTTVREMHSTRDAGPNPPLLALRQQVASGQLVGPRIYTTGDPDYTSPAAAAASVVDLKAKGVDFIKLAFYSGERWPETQPLYDSIVTTARRVGLRVVGHVPRGIPIQRVLGAPWASTEHLYEYVEYVLGLSDRWTFYDNGAKRAYADTAFWMRPGYRLDRAKLQALAQAIHRAKVWNCPTMYMNEDVYNNMIKFVAENGGEQSEILRTAAPSVLGRFNDFFRQVIKALQDAGAGLLLGTDVGPNWTGPGAGFAVHRELAAFVRAGLTPYQALATGTRNVAEFLGTLDSTGTVAVGKRADLVLLAGNPLQDVGYTAGPAGVMMGGRWLPRAELDARLATMGPKIQQARQEVWRH